MEAHVLPAGGLKFALARGRFAVTADLGPSGDTDSDEFARRAMYLRGWVDAVNVTDNRGPRARMSSLGAAVLAQRQGVSPVMQLTCRDRNRMALQADLLAAAALDVPHVLLSTGDHPGPGDRSDAKPVFDLDGVQLISLARTLRDNGALLSGVQNSVCPQWMIGTVENPFGLPLSLEIEHVARKAAAGAEFIQTHCVFDTGVFAQWMAPLRDMGVTERCAILAGVVPIRSLRMLEFLRNEIHGVNVSAEVEQRLRRVPSNRVAEEGMRLCIDTIQRLTAVPGVAGVHLLTFGFERDVPELLERAGLAAQREGSAQSRGGSGHVD